MKLLLIKAMPDGHGYSHFVRALQHALAELGHEAIVSDQAANVTDGVGQTGPLVAELQAVRPDAVVSFSSFFGGLVLANGVSLYDHLGIKFVGWQFDHPIYAPASLRREIQGRYAVYANRNHLRWAQAVKLPGRGLRMMPGGAPPAAPPKPWAEREIPILVAATWNGVPQRLWEQAEDNPGKRLLMGVVDALLADRTASLIDAFNATSTKLKLGARLGDDPALDEMMRGFLCDPLTYVRNIDRINTLSALVEAGLPVAILGGGWEALFGERANVSYLPRVDFQDLTAVYANARVVLNLNAGNGGSERAVYAALAGAAVASDYGEQVDELLGGGQGVAFFNRARPATAAEVVGSLLESPKTEALAQRGCERAARAGLWRHRAQQLVEFLGAAAPKSATAA